MKRIILGTLALFLVAQVYALNITDPFYMPKQNSFVSDTTLAKQNSGNARAYGLKEEVTYGIKDNLSVGVSLGWAKIKHGDSGLQDPVITGRYRIQEEAKSSFVLDVLGYISPEIFDSPLNGDGGVAKGSTDFGVSLAGGSREYLPNTMLWLDVSLDCIGSTKFSKSGTVIGVGANAKYYMDDLNSFDGGIYIKHYSFGDSYTGYGIKLDYARLLQDNLAIVPFWSAESHSDDVPSDVNFGVTLRYTF